ncbi:MAG TPA: hypothetical protein VGM63_19675 [Mucilaginibacter sp.]|jgi:hypothetical protein
MEDTCPYYNLYCINIQCGISIYNHINENEILFTESNLVAAHRCPCCKQQLVSAMDMEIEQVVAEAGIRLSGNKFLNAD